MVLATNTLTGARAPMHQYRWGCRGASDVRTFARLCGHTAEWQGDIRHRLDCGIVAVWGRRPGLHQPIWSCSLGPAPEWDQSELAGK